MLRPAQVIGAWSEVELSGLLVELISHHSFIDNNKMNVGARWQQFPCEGPCVRGLVEAPRAAR